MVRKKEDSFRMIGFREKERKRDGVLVLSRMYLMTLLMDYLLVSGQMRKAILLRLTFLFYTFFFLSFFFLALLSSPPPSFFAVMKKINYT